MPKQIGSPIKKDRTFYENEDNMKNLLRILSAKAEQIKLGGGREAIEKHHKRGKLTARERIEKLIDPGSEFLEIGLYAGYGMYEEYGGAPSAGVVVGIGKIHGRDVVIVANDATVKAGAWFPITCKKNLRAQEIAMENRIPIVYLVDSAGVFLPLQSEIFPDKEHFGRIFRNNAVMSAMGIPQIAAIMGPCVAGGAYLPIMSDEALIVEGTGSVFLAGPHLVKAAIGEEIDIETLGGASVHSEISGVTDYKCKNDEEAIETIRSIISKLGDAPKAGFNRTEPRPPKYDPYEIYGIIPKDLSRPYDMYEVLARIVDDSEIDEYKAGYGKTLICAYARIDGWAVGIVANQRSIVKTKLGEMQVGGVIYSDSADKAARFIMNCNQKKIPIVFFQDVTGFMVGRRAEWGGIIKDGAKMVNAVANSVVPKFTFIIGNSFGAGNYAMCGKAYDPRLIFAWPTAQIAVMGGKQASETLLSIKLSQMEREGKVITPEEQEKLLKEIQERYEKEMEPIFAAARLWVDGIIDPVETRKMISRGIEIANNNPYLPKFNVGVIQT
ncbi:Acetyl-CoA carboxylase, carboxyltransferase component [Candidatus Thermokryptus mobilis]|uniref:Acetyl-CoA carboxylase, carboxyltransferase component n=1 Tax=Candidatus Thermokryptus mobilis TaxID=1643428 RepID=A0A0S4MYB2_9BACT|nr:acyl-CoA carboxylase subunit beta [Candidatus Thermokryptus mobilis]CUU03938.1 Acetyl-CoA carboxylase, carboxyltransferase component [Candidatus Thermokryptus mobilis]